MQARIGAAMVEVVLPQNRDVEAVIQEFLGEAPPGRAVPGPFTPITLYIDPVSKETWAHAPESGTFVLIAF